MSEDSLAAAEVSRTARNGVGVEGEHSRVIVLADACVPIRGAALAARYLAAFVHSQFRAPFGVAREEGLHARVHACMRSHVSVSLAPWIVLQIAPP